MAVSFVGYASAAGSSVTLPAFNAGDLALVFAFRDGSNTAPTLGFGFTDVAGSGANSSSSRVGYRVLATGDTTTETWTNATEIQVLVLRGQNSSPIGDVRAGGASGTVVEYEAFGPNFVGSLMVGMVGHRTATNVHNQSAGAEWTTRSSSGSVTSRAHEPHVRRRRVLHRQRLVRVALLSRRDPNRRRRTEADQRGADLPVVGQRACLAHEPRDPRPRA
jgi:hypothetical protein